MENVTVTNIDTAIRRGNGMMNIIRIPMPPKIGKPARKNSAIILPEDSIFAIV